MSPKKWLPFAIKAAITGVIVWVLLREVDTAQVLDYLSNASIPLLLLATGFFGLQIVLNAQRWRLLLRLHGTELPYYQSARFYLEAMFFNQALPGAVGGDLFRVYRVRAYCTGLTAAANSVILDRLTGLLALLFFIVGAMPTLLTRTGDAELAWGVGIVVAVFVAGIIAVLIFAKLPEEGAGGRPRKALVQMARVLATLVRSPGRAFVILGLAALTHVLLILAAYSSAQALGLPYTLVDCWLVVPTSILIATLPISLGGWGVRESAMATGFALIGAQAAGAVALSIVLGLELLAIGLIGGLVWLQGGSVRPDEEHNDGE